MQQESRTGLALIKHCAWLGIKWIFCILFYVGLLGWLVIGSFFLYKSAAAGLSLSVMMKQIQLHYEQSDSHSPPLTISYCLVSTAAFIVVTSMWGGITGATVGAIAAAIQKLRRPPTTNA